MIAAERIGLFGIHAQSVAKIASSNCFRRSLLCDANGKKDKWSFTLDVSFFCWYPIFDDSSSVEFLHRNAFITPLLFVFVADLISPVRAIERNLSSRVAERQCFRSRLKDDLSCRQSIPIPLHLHYAPVQ